jgi:hypothetical protein
VLKSASNYFYKFEEKKLVFLHFKSFILAASLIFGGAFGIFAQAIAPQSTPVKEDKKENKQSKSNSAALSAEQIAELSVFVYGRLVGGRQGLNQIRKTAVERGKIVVNNPDGTTENANYEMRTMRGESLDKEKIRFDQEFPSSRFALVYSDNKIVGLFNDSVFTPREEASRAFQNQIWRGLEALLRYKENGATVALAGKEKFMGAEYNVLELTDKENRKTRFFVSVKTFRVMWVEYTENDIKYQRKFYDYRESQGTLVPYRTVLFANGKQIEETTILTVTYGQKLDEALFQTS